MFGFVAQFFSGLWAFIAPYFGNQEAVLLFVGLENAGKSSLLYRLKEDKMGAQFPTARPTCETLTCGNITFKTYDLGGHIQARRVWKDYYPATNGIIFLVDGASRETFEESKAELQEILHNEEIQQVPIAVLVNKIDLPECASTEEVVCRFDLYHRITGKDQTSPKDVGEHRALEVFPISVLKRQGYGQAFKWISNFTNRQTSD